MPRLSLKCAIPIFIGLLPEPHNCQVQELLFILAYWHGLAKLRMHTDETLQILDAVMQSVGDKLHKFISVTCPAFSMKELCREAESCRRCQAHNNSKQGNVPQNESSLSTADCQPKVLNLQTYKLHALGDYAAQIRTYGTTDSYSTQPMHIVMFSMLYITLMLRARASLSIVPAKRGSPGPVIGHLSPS